MATEIAKAYVQLIPTAKGFKSKITSALGGDVSSAGSEAGESFGSSMVGKLKGILAAAGIGAIVKEALDAGGALQQSFGGLDTLYGEASQAAKDYAAQAVSAGISMNDYAEQAVSFGASLKQAFEGDVVKAAEAANTAIMDMADNSAKMGTDLSQVQSAYQGFAKQNYTMLDNLKLGYGGTKTEMQRLLADAEKLSGVHYDLDNLGDVYSAIHVIQEDLGLTGVAAEEAEGTFTGSFQAMKAAATNLMAAITSGDIDSIYAYIQTLFSTTENFVIKNLAPMLSRIVSKLPQLLANLVSEVGILLSEAANSTDSGMNFVAEFFTNLIGGLAQSLPDLLAGIWDFTSALFGSIVTFDWMGFINQVVHEIISGFQEGFSYWGNGNNSIMDLFFSWITETLPALAEKGIEMIVNLVNGFVEGLPLFIEQVAPLIADFLAEFAAHLPEIIQTGFELITKLVVGLINAIPKLVASLPRIFKAIKDAFGKYDWAKLGANILEGIKNGILGAVTAVVEAAKNAAKAIFDAVKGFFEIGSPSRLMNREVGKWIPAGIAVGIESNMSDVTKAVDEMNKATLKTASTELDFTSNVGTIESNNSNKELNAISNALNKPTSVTVVLEGDAKRLFKTIQSEATNYNTLTGRNAFA